MVLFVLASAPAVREPFSFYAGAFRSVSCKARKFRDSPGTKHRARTADRTDSSLGRTFAPLVKRGEIPSQRTANIKSLTGDELARIVTPEQSAV